MNEVVIVAGTNIEPDLNMQEARRNLSQISIILNESRVYTTKPVVFTNQPDFLNAAFWVKTKDNKEDFKKKLKEIEKKQGRVKTNNKSGPRCIDLDIVVWNREIVDKDFYVYSYIKDTVLEALPDLKF
ncbi:MAG: 2-amino-4-hydroxy-6-hydroxymethyldihydropteridine diphosphokinase [Leptospiraceae bacterium]|nr:2-amino-4-hydroxy-6-hydroxymethyldihydropteridine diphosphokinase [Leptospiraceae bacterium]MCP5497874.1 2-amino-4-hydroxy-6-hydroxymethyldihydropteridine diphosphokinase [Leptospiraceae bacterium]